MQADDARVRELIDTLRLEPHPEGGWYRRTFRSAREVRREDGEPRAALTAILYLLPGGGCSRWHAVEADETWHHYEGAVLDLHLLDPNTRQHTLHALGPLGADALPQHTVPAGVWQAADATRGYALVGCSVGPGFDFADFRMLSDEPALADDLLGRDERLRALL